MSKNDLQYTIYSYLILYKNGITVETVIDNKDIFIELCKRIDKKCCNANLRFMYQNDLLFEIETSKNKEFSFCIDIFDTDFDILSKLLFSQISCSDFLCLSCRVMDIIPSEFNFENTIQESRKSWERFVERIGYKEDDFFVSDESTLAKEKIRDNHILWCYNKSCTGKTFLGLGTVNK